jgi:hypothetical protein
MHLDEAGKRRTICLQACRSSLTALPEIVDHKMS